MYWFTVEAHLWPHFHGLSLSLESTNPSVGTRLKVHLARLGLPWEKESKDELEFKLKCRQLEAEAAIRIHQLELQSSKLSTKPSTPPSNKDEDNDSVVLERAKGYHFTRGGCPGRRVCSDTKIFLWANPNLPLVTRCRKRCSHNKLRVAQILSQKDDVTKWGVYFLTVWPLNVSRCLKNNKTFMRCSVGVTDGFKGGVGITSGLTMKVDSPPWAWFCQRYLPVKGEFLRPTVTKCLLKECHLTGWSFLYILYNLYLTI